MFGLVASFATNWQRAAAVIAVWVVVGVAVVATAPPLTDVTTNDQENFLPDGSESLRVLQLVGEKYPRGRGIPAIIVFHQPDGLSDADFAAVAGVDETLQAPDAPPDIQNVVALSTSSPLAASSLLAPDGTTVTTIVTISGSPAEEGFRETIRWVRDQGARGDRRHGAHRRHHRSRRHHFRRRRGVFRDRLPRDAVHGAAGPDAPPADLSLAGPGVAAAGRRGMDPGHCPGEWSRPWRPTPAWC